MEPTETQVGALKALISEQQDAALRVASMLEALTFLQNEGAHPGSQITLAEEAERQAAAMVSALDVVNLPEGVK